ncbi:MAG TPA: hypothetical protein VI074_06410 [Propionibacteriaceae bacterium]
MTAWTKARQVGLVEGSDAAPGWIAPNSVRCEGPGDHEAESEDREHHSAHNGVQNPVNADGEGEASGAHEREVDSLYLAASTQLKLASGVIGRVIAGSKRTFDENNGNEQIAAATPKSRSKSVVTGQRHT